MLIISKGKWENKYKQALFYTQNVGKNNEDYFHLQNSLSVRGSDLDQLQVLITASPESQYCTGSI